MIFPEGWWIVLAAAALGCCIGFKNFIWFLSVGYGLAMSLIGAVLGVMSLVNGTFCLPYLLLCAVIFAYGLRLGLFLLIREKKNAVYKKTLDEAKGGTDKKMPMPVLISLWVTVSALFFMQAAPLFYRLTNGPAGTGAVWLWIGLAVSLTGFILEAVADAQKTAQKKADPHMVATKGLYRMCRCPNYFGEILVWTGVLISGVPVVRGAQWIVVLLGYVSIVYIMFNGAKRLELRQTKRCWKQKEYAVYADSTPILIPFLPIYHLITWIH